MKRMLIAACCCLAVGAVAIAEAKPPTSNEGFTGGAAVTPDGKMKTADVSRDGNTLLVYRHATVPVPEPLKGKKYAEPRSDYLHPLCSPDGICLTRDFPNDHPHHRGVYWAWPEVYYKGQKRDLHALQGVFARPVEASAGTAGSSLGVRLEIEAENVWKWNDDEKIVIENAKIRVPVTRGKGYFVDFEFSFRALVDGVSIARRGQRAYGGLNLRTNLMGDQKIIEHTDPNDAKVRRSYAQISGVPDGGKKHAAIAIFQHADNPRYPGDWVKFPHIAWLQPTFPASGEKYPLSKDKPLILRYRYWVQSGPGATKEQLARAWDDYNKKPAKEKP